MDATNPVMSNLTSSGVTTTRQTPDRRAAQDLKGTLGLLQEMDLGPDEIARRKEFLELVAADVERLQRLNEVAEHYADDVIEHFYKHLLSFAECREFFTNPGTLEHVKRMQKGYFLRLTQSNYDQT